MVPGLCFYWFSWAAWVVVTFFMKKGKLRTELAFLILLVILFSNRFLAIGPTYVNASLILILVFCYRKAAKRSRSELLLTVLVCQIITLGYIGFTLYAIHEPAVLWLDRKWMTAILVTIIVLFTVRSYSLRILTTAISAIHGNLLYALVMDRLSLPVKAGTFDFLDMLAVCLAAITVWHGYGQFIQLMNHLFKKTNQPSGHYTK